MMECNDDGINEAGALPITPYYPTHFLLGTQISVVNRSNNDETAFAPSTQHSNNMDSSLPDESSCSHGSTKRVEDLSADDFLKFHDSTILSDANLSMKTGYTITSIRVLPCKKFVEIIFTLNESDYSTTRQRAQPPPRPHASSSSRGNYKSAKKSAQKGGGSSSTNQRASNVEEKATSLCFECSVEFPFFDLQKGWSSFSPMKTTNLYGLECRQLQVGDTCILLLK